MTPKLDGRTLDSPVRVFLAGCLDVTRGMKTKGRAK